MSRLPCGWFRKNDAVITIRSAEPRDARAIAGVHVASWQAAYRGIFPDEVLNNLSVDDRARQWEAGLAKPGAGGRTIVGELDGHVVGFSSHGPARDPDVAPGQVAELYAIYTLETAWGLGCGRALWLEALQRVKRDAATKAITVWVLTDNARGRRFYEKAGFLTDGATKDITLYGVTRSETRYRRPLHD